MDHKVLNFLKEVERKTGAEMFLVGGCVRDSLMKREIKDVDVLARNVPMDDLIESLSQFGKVDQVGRSFGVIRLLPKGLPDIEIALPRKEISTGSGHKDFVVEFDENISVLDDLSRRDFTMNSIARSVSTGEIIDPFDGFNDILMGVISFTSLVSAVEDPLRILRGIRFVAKLGFFLDRGTEIQMRDNAHLLSNISAERIKEELEKIIVAPCVGHAMISMLDLGILDVILPEVDVVDVHRMLCSSANEPDVKMAALLPVKEGRHIVGEFDNPVKNVLERLRFSSNSIRRISILASKRSEKVERGESARRFLSELTEAPGDLRDNIKAMGSLQTGLYSILMEEYDKNPPLTRRDLAVNGQDLINVGLSGKEIGRILGLMLDLVLINPKLNNKKFLMESLKEVV